MIPLFHQLFLNSFLFAPIHYSTSQLKKHNEAPRQYDSMFFDLLLSTKSNYIKKSELFECAYLNIKNLSFALDDESYLRIAPLTLNDFCELIHFICFCNNILRVYTILVIFTFGKEDAGKRVQCLHFWVEMTGGKSESSSIRSST